MFYRTVMIASMTRSGHPSICCDSAGAAGQALITSTKGLDSAPEVGSSMRSR